MGKKAFCTLRSRRARQRARTPGSSSKLLDETKDENLQETYVADLEVCKRPCIEKVRIEHSDSPAWNNSGVTEYDLAMELLAFERLGYISKTDHDTDDESLIQYGDKFGLSVINDFSGFFKLVPQHPHYGQMTLDHVSEGNAENYWDLFMPLIHRGLSAVRNNNKKEIAAVERRIAHFSSQGFNLRHLQAYINVSHRVQEDQSALICAVKKVNSEILSEKKKIDEIIAGKSVVGEIEGLQAEKARYRKVIADIDLLLISKQKLLEEEKSIRATSTTPIYDTLLRTKGDLDKRITEMEDKAKALMIEDAIKSISK